MVYEFGPFRYDAAQRLLFRGAEVAPLGPKTVEILHVLLERRGCVVEKGELLRLVWPDTTVEEIGLARNISMLRKVLEEGSVENPYIETIPRRGYRFAAAVSTDEPVAPPGPAGPEAAPPAAAAHRKRSWLPLLALGAMLLGALIYYQFYTPSRYLSSRGPVAALAVVPFDCLCPGLDGPGLSAGFNEVLVADLAKLPGVQVVSPSTVRRHQRFGISMGLMGRLLGLDVLVEGTIQSRGSAANSGLRIVARLVDVHTGRIVWAETYDEPSDAAAGRPAGFPENVAQAVARQAGVHLSSQAVR